jgi:hypothetical protein
VEAEVAEQTANGPADMTLCGSKRAISLNHSNCKERSVPDGRVETKGCMTRQILEQAYSHTGSRSVES